MGTRSTRRRSMRSLSSCGEAADMSIAPQVALSESFLTALAQLPKPVQKKVREFTTKFRSNPTSSAINYESLHGMRDPKVRTVRIDLAYRAVIVHPPNGSLYM